MLKNKRYMNVNTESKEGKVFIFALLLPANNVQFNCSK